MAIPTVSPRGPILGEKTQDAAVQHLRCSAELAMMLGRAQAHPASSQDSHVLSVAREADSWKADWTGLRYGRNAWA